MAVDDDILIKNPFGFELAGVIINTEHTRQAVTRAQMNSFLSLYTMIMSTVNTMMYSTYYFIQDLEYRSSVDLP